MSAIQDEIREMMYGYISSGAELGLQLCAYHNGELVIDAACGKLDTETDAAVDGDSLFPIFSTGKGLVAAAAHILAERGVFDYGMKISEVWPEFAAHGKENATIEHALRHLTGIPQMPRDATPEVIVNWDLMCEKIAALEPKWAPGTHYQYHSVSYSWVVGEPLRRVDGRPIERIVHEEIFAPLGLTDMYFGIPDEVEPRVATLYEPNADPDFCVKDETMPPNRNSLPEWMNRADIRRAVIPASNGIASARALAKAYAALLPGGTDGAELLPPARLKTALAMLGQPCEEGSDRAMGFQVSYDGLGETYALPHFGHWGYGGAFAYAWPEEKLAMGFTRNLYTDNDNAGVLIKKIRDYYKK